MDENTTIDELEQLAGQLGIRVRYEAINLDKGSFFVSGGLCQLRGEYLIIINSRSRMTERIQILAKALKHFDLDQVYIKPAIREILDKAPAPSVIPNATEEKHV